MNAGTLTFQSRIENAVEPISSVSEGIKAVLTLKGYLDKKELENRVDDLERQVDQLGRRVAEGIFAQVRAGFKHLSLAVGTSDSELRRDELGCARGLFSQLSERESDGGIITGTRESRYTDEVVALGHVGNFYYFVLKNRPEHALIEAYRCTERFPALGVRFFPPELFSRDYRYLVPHHSQTRVPLENEYLERLADGRRRRLRYGKGMAWRVPAAAGLFLGGLIAGAVNPGAPVAGARGAMNLIQDNDEGMLLPALPDRLPYDARADRSDRQLAPVIDEARERRHAVERRLGIR